MVRKKGKEESAALVAGELPSPVLGASRGNERIGEEQSHGMEEQVSDLFGKLNLTTKEKDTFGMALSLAT
jgi:hypothetical protein